MPPVIDFATESKETTEAYGIGQKETDAFGKRCLLARRLVEKGVRFVQVYAGGWDSHDFIESAHKSRMRAIDRPIAGLLKDLKRRGMLDSTLVIWGGEFGGVQPPGAGIITRMP
jgi:membrane-anchored protein YejM (alkaline phosphatase superfamily)